MTKITKLTKRMDPVREAITIRAKSIMDMLPSIRDFERKTGIPYATLQHWTDIRKNGLPESSVDDFINALKVYGVDCSHEWMMHGRGVEPRIVNPADLMMADELPKRIKKHRADKAQAARITEELNAFLNWDKEAIGYIVPDDSMEPRFIGGEIVAGIRHYGKAIEKLIGQDCIVLIENKGEFYLRKICRGNLPGHFHLAHTNIHTIIQQPFTTDVKLISAAPVIWTRRKDSF